MEKQELYDMCKTIIDLNKQNFIILKNEVENIINNNIKDEKYILLLLSNDNDESQEKNKE